MKKTSDTILRVLTYFFTGLTLVFALSLIGYISYKGILGMNLDLFSPVYTSENCSVVPALVNTIIMTLLSLIISVPLGVGAAVFLCEYAHRQSVFVKVVRLTSETLAGIPSIIYGLFGYLFFLVRLHWDYSLLSGALTLSMMILPSIMRTTEEALLAVPDAWREGSYGLGAGKRRTIMKILLPASMPGILSGVILAIGRIVGETAALLYTAGSVAQIPSSLMGSGRTLSVHLYVLATEGLHIDEAYATAFILLIIVAGINALSSFAAKRIGKGK